MTLFAETCQKIAPLDPALVAATQRTLDFKTKPRRSLGRLEDLACRIVAIRGTANLGALRKALVVMAADHGVVEEGVSAYPQEVTGQMVLNFAKGGAAVNVLARQAGARLLAVDMGVKHMPPDVTGVRRHPVAPGTRNFAREPAMSAEQALAAIETGIRIAEELAREEINLIGLGEMGIGNTTAASAITAVLAGALPRDVVGRGTGIDDSTLAHKARIVEEAIALHRLDASDPLKVLSHVGGFEIAGLCGVVLGAAALRVPVVVDGFIASSAALVAIRLCPAAAAYLVASHRSTEPGAGIVLAALGERPLLDLELRLGEGTGAALAFHVIEAAVRILGEMATFESAGVTDSGA